jgi:UDP-N-acetylglucosamine 2-epimerase (non-hydrolysing)
MTKRVFLVVGTRPEAIKMAPVIAACREHDSVDPVVCFTGQHREMLQQVASYFGIKAEVDLELMEPNQSLATLTSRCISQLDAVMGKTLPDCVVAQGDTTTVMAASLVSFYRHIDFVHVEAGLRSGDLTSPWPEELNRRIVSLTTRLHCAPTDRSRENLLREGVPSDNIQVTGNTVIDALLWTLDRESTSASPWPKKYEWLDKERMILITGHRRENLGKGIQQICIAIRELALSFRDVRFLYPVHLNPQVRDAVFAALGGLSNVHLVDPVPYPEFVWLMHRSTIIISDSGGVQEEAPSLRRPVLVTRDNTERPEGVQVGAVELVGTRTNRIVERVSHLLSDPAEYARHQVDKSPYGDGAAALRIVRHIAQLS